MNKLINRNIKQLKRLGFIKYCYSIIYSILTKWIKKYYYNKLQSFNSVYFIKEINNNLILIDTKDKGIAVDLFINKEREPFFRKEFCSNVLKKGQTVIDIGANIGYYALTEASIVGVSGRVYAIEPVSKNIELLINNIKLNNLENINTYQCAIGNYNGNIDIGISEYSNLCSATNKIGILKYETVPIITLDKFITTNKLEQPDVIRMDVEGYETEIIKGAINTLSKGITICMELHNAFLIEYKTEYKVFIKLLKSLGYEIIFASIEPLPVFNNSLRKLDSIIGTKKGIVDIKLDDLLNNPKVNAMDWIEIILKKVVDI
jgi:FkbM family methyltransferase